MDYVLNDIPDFLVGFLKAPELVRLKNIGMNCGCEYTDFPRFRSVPEYSRFQHSVGVALIIWKFTRDRIQTLAGLFHDIATPVFAHSVDFFRGDYLSQESTEDGTETIIRGSSCICHQLDELGISVDEVKDYHRYPIADNDTPRLSADRLEYTLGNLWRYRFRTEKEAYSYMDGLVVAISEDGSEELAFKDAGRASAFAMDALKCSEIYVAEEDRFAMQRLAEILQVAVDRGIISEKDLYLTEPEVIGKLMADRITSEMWAGFCRMNRMIHDESAPEEERRIIRAKKRYIDPLVEGKGRVSDIDVFFRDRLNCFLQESQEQWLWGC